MDKENKNRVKYKICFLFLMLISFSGLSQPKDFKLLTGTEKTNIEKKIATVAKTRTSLQCKFEQNKLSILLTDEYLSTGKLYYKAPDCLRWEYTKPNKYLLIFNKDNAYIEDEKGVVVANKMLKQLGNFIISTINGNSLIENGNFKIEYYEEQPKKNIIIVKLTPINKRLKEMYASIQISISLSDCLAYKIVMEEKSGDVTKIMLSDKKINEQLPQNLFLIP